MSSYIISEYPTIKEKLVNAAFINGTAKVSIYIKDVYPIPTCIAKMNVCMICLIMGPSLICTYLYSSISTFICNDTM